MGELFDRYGYEIAIVFMCSCFIALIIWAFHLTMEQQKQIDVMQDRCIEQGGVFYRSVQLCLKPDSIIDAGTLGGPDV